MSTGFFSFYKNKNPSILVDTPNIIGYSLLITPTESKPWTTIMLTRQRIEAARLKLGWSYFRLAKEAGLNDDTVRLYLQNQIDTASEKADALLKAVRDADSQCDQNLP